MEQSVAAANTKTEAFRNHIRALEEDLYRARISRVGTETELLNVRGRWSSYNQANCSTALPRMQLRKAMDDGKKEFSDLSTELRKTQEALSVASLTIERQRKAGESKAMPSSQREAQLQKEVDKCMVGIKRESKSRTSHILIYPPQSILKCSTCKQNMRSTVLTKCLHSAFSFCPALFHPALSF
jgi:hypothetical protein